MSLSSPLSLSLSFYAPLSPPFFVAARAQESIAHPALVLEIGGRESFVGYITAAAAAATAAAA